MKLLKKLFFILMLLTFNKQILSMSPFGSGQLPPPPSPEELDAMLKDVDFDKMLKELEEIFGDMKDDDLKPPQKPKAEEKKEPEKKPLKPGEKPLTQEEKFIKPAQKEEKPVAKVPPEKLQAFYHYVDKFLNLIENLDLNISNFSIGIALKEELENQKPSFKEALNQIKVELKNIKSKKLYIKFFFLPSYTPTRQKIIDSLKKIEKINNELKDVKESEETEDEQDIEYLKELAGKKENKKDPKSKIKTDIKNLLSSDLSQISKDLKTITASQQAITEIKKKKEKREQLEKQATQKAKQPGYRPPWSPSTSPWSGPGRSSGYGGDYWSGPTSKPASYPYSTGYKPTPSSGIERSQQQKGSSAETPGPAEEKKSDEQKSGITGGEKTHKDKISKKMTLTKEVLELLEKIQKIYKSEDEKTYSDILNTTLLSQISTKLDEINKTDLTKDQQKRLETQKEYQDKQLQNALNKFISACIRLAKYPENPEEQKSALQIFNIIKDDSQKTDELKKYEKSIIDKVKDKQVLLNQFLAPIDEIKDLPKNLNILFARPQGDITEINPIKNAYSNAFRRVKNTWEQIPQALTELIQIKDDILAGRNPINDLNNLRGQINALVPLPQPIKTEIIQKAEHIANVASGVNLDFTTNQATGNAIKQNLETILKTLEEKQSIVLRIGDAVK